MNEQVGDYEATKLLLSRYSVRQVCNYYMKKATQAMRNAEVALTGPNTESYIAHSSEAFANLKMLDFILSDAKNTIDVSDKKA